MTLIATLLALPARLPDYLPPTVWYFFVPPILIFALLNLTSELLRDHTPKGKVDEAPYMPVLPFVGHFYQHSMDKMVLHGTEAMVSLGKVVKLFMPGMRAIIVFDPSEF